MLKEDAIPRIVRNTQILSQPYVLGEKKLTYEEVQSVTVDDLRRDVEGVSFQRGYGQAQAEYQTAIDQVARKLSDLKNDIYALMKDLQSHANR